MAATVDQLDKPLPPVKVALTTVRESWIDRNTNGRQTLGQQIDKLLENIQGRPTELTLTFPKEEE